MWQKSFQLLQILPVRPQHLFRFKLLLFRSIFAAIYWLKMDSSLSDHTAALTQGERKHHPEIWKLSFLFRFLNALASLMPEVLSWRQRYWGPSLTDVLWHELSSADVRTAEGFDSVHFRYPLPKWSWSEQTPLPAPPGKLHIGLSPTSESGDCSWMLTLNMATACNVLLNSKICHFGRVRCKYQILSICIFNGQQFTLSN